MKNMRPKCTPISPRAQRLLWIQSFLDTDMKHRHINRKAQVEKLSKLVEQKHNIEAEIVTSLQTVDQARAEIAQQFTIVLKGRVEELE